jgi:iron(III) transport system substrate-binding protein
LVDAYELNSPSLIIPRDQGLLQPFSTPESAGHPPESIESGRHWIVARESYLGIGYNTDVISAQEAPKTYRDLLDPRWKGKMAISGSNGTAAPWIGAMIAAEGMDYVRQLSEQNIRVYSMLGRALANLTISGEAPLSPTTFDSHVLASRAQGAPIAWNAPGLVPVTDGSAALAAAAPHPHAAMLFIDFLLSKEGALIYQDLGYTPSRFGVGTERYPGLKRFYPTNQPNYLSDYEQWVKISQDLFIRRNNSFKP